VEPPAQVDPPRVEKLPVQRATIFHQVPEQAIALFGHGVTVDVNTLKELISSLITFVPGTQDSDFIAVVA
jgi:hypothetical protein